MKRIGTIVLALALAVAAVTAQDLERQFKAAMNTELVDGKLNAAIAQYKKVAAGSNRALAAQALVHMAECYQKLGDAQARQIYERVVREYADQRDLASLAQARLSAGEAASMASRRIASVPIGGIGYGTVSPDGRYFPYTNWNNGDLYLRDLVTGANRALTRVSGLDSDPSQFAEQAAFSKDGRQVAYAWAVGRRVEIRTIDASGTAAQPHRVFSNDDITSMSPDDWSADGKWLSVQIRRQGRTAQVGVLSVADGSLHVLKSVDWRGATRLMFSPDGKYLAYDLPIGDTGDERDVFILAVDGSRDVPVAAHPGNDLVMGWSSDGSALLFSSDRSGVVGLWEEHIVDGKPQGSPDLVKPEIDGAPLGVASNGALYTLVHHPSFNSSVSADVQVATFDFATGRFLTPPLNVVRHFVGTNNFPVWSPDGKALAYVAQRRAATDPLSPSRSTAVIGIRSTDTGEVRELRTALNMSPFVRWSADGRSLLTYGRDAGGRQGMYRIDVQTQRISSIAQSSDDAMFRWPSESPDGTTLYYMRNYAGSPERAIVARDLRSGTERELVRRQGLFGGPGPMLSPDGRRIVVARRDPTNESWSLLLVPTPGGDPREIFRAERPRFVALQAWTSGGAAILVAVSDRLQAPGVTAPGASTELWRVPLDGGKPRKLDLDVAGMTPFSVHPDGRQIAFGLTQPAKNDEVWVLEHFLRAPDGGLATKTRASARR